MEFIFGERLQRAIGEILREDDFICAVAFWGKGASARLSKREANAKRPKIICNLETGGTNPYEIETLMGNASHSYGEVRQSKNLHAKVFLAADRAVVGSANVSTNGLGIEGASAAKWIEAGVLINDPVQLKRISAWLETEWEKSEEIEASHLVKARDRWFRRQMASGPILDNPSPKIGLAEFPVPPLDSAIAGVDFPLLNWWRDVEYDWSSDARSTVAKLISTDDRTKIEARLENTFGIDLRDSDALSPGKWVLVWEASGDRNLPSRMKPYWFYTGPILRRAMIYAGDPGRYPAILGADYKGRVAPPFTLDSPTIKAFRTVIVHPKFSSLLEDDFPFFTPQRLSLMRDFLVDWKTALSAIQ